MLEMTAKMGLLGAKISEIAMLLDTQLRSGSSKMRIARTVRGYLGAWISSMAWPRRPNA